MTLTTAQAVAAWLRSNVLSGVEVRIETRRDLLYVCAELNTWGFTDMRCYRGNSSVEEITDYLRQEWADMLELPCELAIVQRATQGLPSCETCPDCGADAFDVIDCWTFDGKGSVRR